jgi:hypothetical protein
MILWQLHTSYYVAGLVFKDRIVVQAAPIIGYMKGWSTYNVEDYCDKKGIGILCLNSISQ